MLKAAELVFFLDSRGSVKTRHLTWAHSQKISFFREEIRPFVSKLSRVNMFMTFITAFAYQNRCDVIVSDIFA